MTSAENMVDVRHLGAQTPDGNQVVLMSQHLYEDLLRFAGGDQNGLRVIVPDLALTATLVSEEGGSARYEARHSAVVISLREIGPGKLAMSYPPSS
jgi:hypothetical protein